MLLCGLSIIFERKKWKLGKAPDSGKNTNIIPIFLKGKEQDLKSISFTSIPGKLME